LGVKSDKKLGGPGRKKAEGLKKEKKKYLGWVHGLSR